MTTVTYAGYELDDIVSDEMQTHLFPVLNGNTVLDLGIGGGHAVSPLAFKGMNITGVDFSMKQLEFCIKGFSEAGLSDRLSVVWADAFDFLNSSTERFDVVMMTDFLMFFSKSDGKKLVSLAFDALAANGLMWIATRSTNCDLYQDLQWQTPIDTDTFVVSSHCAGTGLVCFYHPQELDEFLTSLGANVIFSTETENRAGAMTNIILVQK